MPLTINDDPLSRRSVVTHDAVLIVDAGDPADAVQFLPVLNANKLILRVSLVGGGSSGTVGIKVYSGRQGVWFEGASEAMTAPGFYQFAFTTYGARVAPYVKAIAGGGAEITIEAVLGVG